MFSTLRTRFGIPGVISVMALIFAMLGGAYAASDSGEGKGATASAKAKKGPRGPRGPQGPAGPQGPQGPQGLPGANGKDGTNGTNGNNGAPGKSVAVTPVDPGEAECAGRGGAIVKQEGAGSGTEVCNGEEGAPGENGKPWAPENELPEGATLTGAWSTTEEGVNVTLAKDATTVLPVSFSLPLTAAPAFVYVPSDGQGFDDDGIPEKGCHGVTDGVPQADPGTFCVYGVANFFSPSATVEATGPDSTASPAVSTGPTGAILTMTCPGGGPSGRCFATGVWAVTG